MINNPLKTFIRRRVTETFNDASKGERPITRRDTALFAPDTVAWRVHGDVVTMLIGGVASLMLQMLHPRVLAGVWDHSSFREDMHARLRGTAKFIATTTYADRPLAEALIAKVNGLHAKVKGTLPDGTPYSALEAELLAWVHVTEAWSFLASWKRYGEPGISAADQDAYFAEMERIALALGADPIPRSLGAAEALIEQMRPQLRADERSHEVSRLVMTQKVGGASTAAASKVLMAAAIDLLPDWARRMHGFDDLGARRPAVRVGAMTMARTLRWAFRESTHVRIYPPGQERPWD